MEWLSDLLKFLLIPGLVVFAAVWMHRGAAKRYKIVKETDSLGGVKYEVWFEYYSIHGCHGWLHKETFDTEQQADEFIARQHKTRETVREGKL